LPVVGVANGGRLAVTRGPSRRDALKAGIAIPLAAQLPDMAHAQGAALARIIVRNPGRAEHRPAAWTSGLALPRGALPSGATVELRHAGRTIPSQLDRFNAWPDGSLRFGAVSAVLPTLASGAETPVDVYPGAGNLDSTASISAAEVAAYLEANGGVPRVEWLDRDRGRYTADAATALRGQKAWDANAACLAGRWLSGLVCTEWVCSVPLVGEQGPHPSIRIWFHCRAWRNGPGGDVVGARVHVVLDNSVSPRRVETRDAVGDVMIARGAQVAWGRQGRPVSKVRWDNPVGTTIKGAPSCAIVTAEEPVFDATHRFQVIDIEGTAAHILEIRSPREAVARIMWSPDVIVRAGTADAAHALRPNTYSTYRGAVHLYATRRVRIQSADKKDLQNRRFVVEGVDPLGKPITEAVVIGADGVGSGQSIFNAVTRIVADGPVDGRINVGTAALAGYGSPPAARLWGMTLGAATRWPCVLRYGAAVEAEPLPESIVRSRIVPHYDVALLSKQLGSLVDTWTQSLRGQCDSDGELVPNSRSPTGPDQSAGNVVLAGSQPGGRPELAVIPGQHVNWLLQPNRANRDIMYASAQVFHQWPYQYRDRATGLCVDPARHPTFSSHTNEPDDNKPPHIVRRQNSICEMDTDREHWMEFNYVPFLVSADLVHYETLYQTAIGNWVKNPATWPDGRSPGFDRALVQISGRGIAWAVRSLGHIVACGPDRLYDAGTTAERTAIDRLWASQQKWLKTLYIDGPDRLGLRPEDRGAHKFLTTLGSDAHPYAPWGQAYLSTVIGHLAELEVLDANGRAFFNWYKTYSIDQVDPRQTNPAVMAGAYYVRARRPDGTALRSLGEMYEYMATKEWPVPSSYLFNLVKPTAMLAVDGERPPAGSTVRMSVTSKALRSAGIVGLEFVGRQIYTPADKGLGTITSVVDTGDGRGNQFEVKVEAPFGSASYAPGAWQLQLPPAGKARYLSVDPTQPPSFYYYYLMAALASLMNAGVSEAGPPLEMLQRMAQNSNATFPEASALLTPWAISPHG
jgi:hypothetical protein